MASPPRPLRVLTVASTFPAAAGDGTPSFVRDLAVGMAVDADTLVLVPAVPGGAPLEAGDGITVRRYRFFPRRWEDVAAGALLENVRSRKSRLLQVPPLLVSQFFAVRKAVREHRPDVIHAHWIIPQGCVTRWAAPRLPTVVTTLGGDLYALRDPVSRAVKRSVVRRARAVTVMNTDMRELVIGLGADPLTTSVRPMGAQVSHFAEAAAARGKKRSGPVELLAVGRLVEKKGFHVLLEALAGVPSGSWHLTIVGDGPERSALEKLAQGLPVTFAGQLSREQLSRADADADIAIFPSVRAASGDQDGLPVALLEAMASGCAVVVSDLPGLDEAVVDGKSGIVTPSGEVGTLRSAIAALVEDPDRRAALGKGAAARAQHYDVSSVARDYLELLRSVATQSN
jgi:glycosyltransferase involved in cell wall biosynthesis